jgi:hypothetical protein
MQALRPRTIVEISGLLRAAAATLMVNNNHMLVAINGGPVTPSEQILHITNRLLGSRGIETDEYTRWSELQRVSFELSLIERTY